MRLPMPHRVDCLGPPADGSCQEIWNVQVGLGAGSISDANGLVSELRALLG